MSLRIHYIDWREAIRAIVTNFNASFNGSNRMVRGVDTTYDVIIDDPVNGLVLKSPNGHYWRANINNLGIVTWADLGTTKP